MITTSQFTPPWWLRNPHAQTIWPALFRKIPVIPLQRERFELDDGDFVDLDWTEDNAGPVVIMLHGLEGDSKSHYAHTMLKALASQGYQAGLLYLRGRSGEVNRLPRTYHSGDTADLAHVVGQLRERWPERKLFAIGISLGGNILLKWLGETTTSNPLQAAVAVSVPFVMSNIADQLDQGFSVIYRNYLVKSMVQSLRRKQAMTFPFDISQALNSKSLRDYDEVVTAPLHGYADADDYYEKCSCRQFLKSITVPSLILHAKDDPFMTTDAIPTAEELSPAVTLELSHHGGHVGFTGGTIPWRAEYWLEQRIVAYFSSL